MSNGYWDEIVTGIQDSHPMDAWRAYMYHVYLNLIQDWLPVNGKTALKTDLFEEAVSPHAPFYDLGGLKPSESPKKHSSCPFKIQCHPSHSTICCFSFSVGKLANSFQQRLERICFSHFFSGGIAAQKSRQNGNVFVFMNLAEIWKLKLKI